MQVLTIFKRNFTENTEILKNMHGDGTPGCIDMFGRFKPSKRFAKYSITIFLTWLFSNLEHIRAVLINISGQSNYEVAIDILRRKKDKYSINIECLD